MRRILLLILCLGGLAALPSSAAATHVADLDCGDFADRAAAQAHLAAHPGDPDQLDGNADGQACEALPCPCSATTYTPPPPTTTPLPAPTTVRPTTATTSVARVLRVIDGDTLKVVGDTGVTATVRLIGIDTPETRKPGAPVECGGMAATARMKKLALRGGVGGRVTLTTDPTQAQVDRFGRLLAYVSADGVDFGRAMISSGWAKVYVFGRDFQRVSTYRRAQASARAARRGVARTCSGKFHRAL